MSYLLENKVSLITGSNRGLGLGIAECLADGGSKIALNYHGNREVAEQAREKLQAKGVHVMLIRADVTDKFQVSSMVEAVEEKWGSVDILVPNATGPQPQKPIEEYDADFYREMYEFFVLSPFLLTQSALPGMKKRKWGRIINITSEVYHASVPQFTAYVAAKGGQIGWSRSLSVELASSGITVNTVAPGWIPTDRHINDPEEDKDAYLHTIPMGRWGTAEDVGSAVRFFASDEAGFITGQTLCVNGGRTPW